MNPPIEDDFAVLIGIDWADREHAVCLKDTTTGRVEMSKLPHTPDAIETWAQALCRRFSGKPIAVSLEQRKGPLLYALLKYDFLVLFPVHPQTLARYRSTFTPSHAKDDPTDAFLIMELLERHRDRLTPWQPQSKEIRQLGQLVEMRRTLVADKVRMTNRITAALKNHYPLPLDLFEEKDTLVFCAFLEKWPNLEQLKRAHTDTIERFFLSHRSCSQKRNKERINRIKVAIALTEDQGIIMPNQLLVTALIGQLRACLESIKTFEGAIAKIHGKHEDAPIFDSLPGAAESLSPRLLVAFGEDRERYAQADDITKFGGIAPVTVRSGNSEWIHWRYACPTFLRQSFVEWTNQSIKYSFWARAYYLMQRERGKSHQVAIRALAFKWIRIIFRCWKNRTPYDENRYLMALQKRGSTLLNYLAQTEKKA